MTPRARLEIAGAVALPLAGFLACLAMHGCQRKPAPEPPAPTGWTAPSGKAPKIADAPGVPVAVVRGSGGFSRKIPPPSGKPAPPPDPGTGPPAGSGGARPGGSGCFQPTADDLAIECDAELAFVDGHPFARLSGDAMVQTPAGIVSRGKRRLQDVAFDFNLPAAQAQEPRTLLGVSGGITSGPGYELGGLLFPKAWAFDSRLAEGRVGVYARAERELAVTRGAAGVVILFGVGRR